MPVGPPTSGWRAGAGAPDLRVPLSHHRASVIVGADLVGSENWSGYAQSAAAGTFTGVTATFDVTTVNTSVPGTQYSSDWVGIDGFSDQKLVQAGIEEDNIGGAAYYGAWTEVLPKVEDPLPLTVLPGDQVTVKVRETSSNWWIMKVTNDTTDQSASRVVFYRAPGKSVEAIHERPCIEAPCNTNSDLANLATTSDAVFDPAQFTSSPPGTAAVFQPLLVATGGATLYDIVMVSNSGSTALATPSGPNATGDGFTVADGGASPPPP